MSPVPVRYRTSPSVLTNTSEKYRASPITVHERYYTPEPARDYSPEPAIDESHQHHHRSSYRNEQTMSSSNRNEQTMSSSNRIIGNGNGSRSNSRLSGRSTPLKT